MDNNFIASFSSQYEQLIPKSKESLLVLMLLRQKQINGYFHEEFSLNQFKECLSEVDTLLNNSEQTQPERIQKELSHYYLQTTKDSGFRLLTTTEFASDFYNLFAERIENQLSTDSFLLKIKDTIRLEVALIENISDMDYWHRFHFKASSRKVILAHIDELQRVVDEEVNNLRFIINNSQQDIKKMIERVLETFYIISKKAEEISLTLNFKEDLQIKLRNLRQKFNQEKEASILFDSIEKDVNLFFDKIDRRIYAINDKIQISTYRLKSFYENFSYQNIQRKNLDAYLNHLLKSSYYDKKGKIITGKEIKTFSIPYTKYKLPSLPLLDFNLGTSRDVPNLQEKSSGINSAEMEKLIRQDKIESFMEKAEIEMEQNGFIDFTTLSKNILESEKNYEVLVQVLFNLYSKYNSKEENNYSMERFNKLNFINEEFALWNLKALQINTNS